MQLARNDVNQGLTTDKAWSVYLILCANGSLYCGISNDVSKRWRVHCAGKGAKYTRMHKPQILKVLQDGLNARAARQLEYRIKQLPSKDKQLLWQDLAECARVEASCKIEV